MPQAEGGILSSMPKTKQAIKVHNFVNSAVDFMKKNGFKKSIKVFNEHDGPFDQGNLYLYILDLDKQHRMIVYTGSTKNISVEANWESIINPNGMRTAQMIVDSVTGYGSSGEAWFEYAWTVPETGKKGRKISFVKRLSIEGQNLVIGSGYY
jgi:hypothetical protein